MYVQVAATPAVQYRNGGRSRYKYYVSIQEKVGGIICKR